MTEETELATEVAGGEAVQPEAIEQKAEAAEAPESTEGQVETDMPAEDEAKKEAEAEEERKSRNQRRREAKERLQRDLAEKSETAKRAQDELERVKTAAENLPRPKEGDFETFEEYQSALSTYGTLKAIDARRIAELEEAAKTHFTAVKDAKEAQAREDSQVWESHVAEGRKKYSDFEEVALRQAPINTPQAAQIVVQSDHAADVAYMIGKNPQIAGAFADMEQRGDYIGLARLVGNLEAQVSAPKPKLATDAPDPIKPVRPKATASKRPEEMTPAEYDAWREKGGTFTL